MNSLMTLAADPAAWLALITLIAMEVVLGIDNLIFISILTNKLPEAHRAKARRVGISLALIMRLALLGMVALIVQADRRRSSTLFGNGFSWRDLILLAGGLFLIWKATKEIHHNTDTGPQSRRVRAGRPAWVSRPPSARSSCSTSCSRSTASSPPSA